MEGILQFVEFHHRSIVKKIQYHRTLIIYIHIYTTNYSIKATDFTQLTNFEPPLSWCYCIIHKDSSLQWYSNTQTPNIDLLLQMTKNSLNFDNQKHHLQINRIAIREGWREGRKGVGGLKPHLFSTIQQFHVTKSYLQTAVNNLNLSEVLQVPSSGYILNWLSGKT